MSTRTTDPPSEQDRIERRNADREARLALRDALLHLIEAQLLNLQTQIAIVHEQRRRRWWR